ncbi:MAG TPA: phosphoribosylformylglycinamidine synthase subunit PurL [Candidatus Limnocylindria bacterium]|nr:phosphoribosylformylglycinamidine synthase subunit PurL [Candidatus Limnocylindria bacterium]
MDLLSEVGLTPFEGARVRTLLGREPIALEWAMFGAMWSEHCAYKHSKKLLRTLPTKGARVALGPGENAGAVDLGDGLLCAFKVESHNHPSAVEPYQGAATGVGGILRDVFAMGARPVAVLNALFFGPPTAPRARRLLSGVVGGISYYGNCVGIPDVGGHVSFEPCYLENPLVNAMCVGLVPRDRLSRANTARPGSAVYLVGSDTGRDGIAGASLLASFELGTGSDEKRPSVQVGNPFLEKLLMEATLELVESGAVEAVQDLGAAGLTCASSEVAARSGVGMRIDVDSVPRRAKGMSPYEVMLSESQERMLVVARPGRESDVERIFRQWELHGVRIGEVTQDKVLTILSGDEVVASLPPALLADEAPEYDISKWAKDPRSGGAAEHENERGGGAAEVEKENERGSGEVEGGAERLDEGVAPRADIEGEHDKEGGTPRRDAGPDRGNVAAAEAPRGNVGSAASRADAPLHKIGLELLELLASPAVASRAVIYRTYDQMVGTDTVLGPGADAALLRIKGRRDGVAIAIDAQPRVAALDPFVGAASAVAEALRNLVCVGAQPLAITDCLNLGNPERPEGAWQLERTIDGIRAACDALGVPVVSGNVSLYNATRGADIWPTAVIGAVGHLDDVTAHIPVTTGRRGDVVMLAGSAQVSIGASAYGAQIDVHEGPVAMDLGLESRLQRFVLAAHRAGLVRAAHDRAEGGLGVALAELALRDRIGMKVVLPAVRGIDRRVALFGEGPSGVVLVLSPSSEAQVRALASQHDVPVWTLGTIGGDLLEIAPVLGTPVASLIDAHSGGLARALGRVS